MTENNEKSYHLVIFYADGLSCSVTHAKGANKAAVIKEYTEREGDGENILSISIVEAENNNKNSLENTRTSQLVSELKYRKGVKTHEAFTPDDNYTITVNNKEVASDSGAVILEIKD